MCKKYSYHCEVCGITFLTFREMKEHLRSKAHKINANKGRGELILDRFINALKMGDKRK